MQTHGKNTIPPRLAHVDALLRQLTPEHLAALDTSAAAVPDQAVLLEDLKRVVTGLMQRKRGV